MQVKTQTHKNSDVQKHINTKINTDTNTPQYTHIDIDTQKSNARAIMSTNSHISKKTCRLTHRFTHTLNRLGEFS